MNLNIIWIIFAAQIFIGIIIFAVLKKVLDDDLLELALEKLKNSPLNLPANEAQEIKVITHKPLKNIFKNRLEKIVEQKRQTLAVHFSESAELKGGIVIQIGREIIDCSLLTRLKHVWSNS